MSVPRTLALPRHVRRLEVASAGAEPLAALEARPPEGVPPRGAVVLLPGFTGSKEDFLELLGPLAEQGLHAVALDQRGQHESPHGEPGDYALDRLAADVLAVRDGLAGRTAGRTEALPCHLVGHSFGGLVARAAVLADPHAFASVTLLCSGPAAVPEPSAGRARMLLAALDQLDLATLWGALRQLDVQAGLPQPPPDVLDFLRRRWLGNDPEQLRCFARALLEEPDRVAELRAALDTVGTVAAVVHGEADDVWPVAVQEDMARRLGAGYRVVRGTAHSPAAEAPARTAAALAPAWSPDAA